MPSAEAPPTQVLMDAICLAMGESPVCAAVFVTFQLEPQFFEDHILGRLLGVPDRGTERVRRMLVQQRIRALAPTLVLYDVAGLIEDGPSVQAVEYVPVRAAGGCLHAKHVLLLLGTLDKPAGLVVATTSANLTESGWWKNVECADVRRLEPGQATSLRGDIVDLLAHVSTWRGDGLNQESLSAMARFVADLPRAAEGGLPRMWLGKEPLHRFMARHTPAGAKLELIAPFVDEDGTPVKRMVEALTPGRTSIMLPVDREEKVAAGVSWLKGVRALEAEVRMLAVDRSMGARSDFTRFVHAKVIRVRKEGRAWTLVGSPNLSIPGHAGWLTASQSRNIETAILVEEEDSGPWLSGSCEEREIPAHSTVPPEEDRGGSTVSARLRVHWGHRTAELRLDSQVGGLVAIGRPGQVAASRKAAFTTSPGSPGEWRPLPEAESLVILHLIEDMNVVAVWADGYAPQTVMVEEQGLALAPSRVDGALTHAEILRHWALLHEQDRQHHLADVLGHRAEADPEAPLGARGPAALSEETMFDAYAGVIHAFLMLQERVESDLKARPAAVARVATLLLGDQADSLPKLLEHLRSAEGVEGLYRLVTWLCAQELWTRAIEWEPSIKVDFDLAARQLEARLQEIDALWVDALEGTPEGERSALRQWIEEWWVRGVEVVS